VKFGRKKKVKKKEKEITEERERNEDRPEKSKPEMIDRDPETKIMGGTTSVHLLALECPLIALRFYPGVIMTVITKVPYMDAVQNKNGVSFRRRILFGSEVEMAKEKKKKKRKAVPTEIVQGVRANAARCKNGRAEILEAGRAIFLPPKGGPEHQNHRWTFIKAPGSRGGNFY